MKNPDIKPKVTLVGAGPGDADLLTIKGAKALAQADAVLYDALVNPEILALAPTTAQKLFVGKRKGNHAFTQDEINQLIVDYAFTYGNVVRLKGGDSFIFGRGHEELSFVSRFGIETAVVPGLSSSIAVPAAANISLTQRGISESFWVITGTKSNRELSTDLHLAAQSSATVVVLMGMSKLSEIVSIYNLFGQEELPIGIIQNGTTKAEKSVFGTLKNIETLVEEKQIGSPAIIVIGEVVRPLLEKEDLLFEKNILSQFTDVQRVAAI